MHEAGAEEDQCHRQHHPGEILHCDVVAEHFPEMPEQPHSGGVAHRDAEVHREGHNCTYTETVVDIDYIEL